MAVYFTSKGKYFEVFPTNDTQDFPFPLLYIYIMTNVLSSMWSYK